MSMPNHASYHCPDGRLHDFQFGERTLVGQTDKWLKSRTMANVYQTPWKCGCGQTGIVQGTIPVELERATS